MVDDFGSRTVFFVRHAGFVDSDEDPTEPSNDDVDGDSHSSERIVTEPFDPMMDNDGSVRGLDNGPYMDIQQGLG